MRKTILTIKIELSDDDMDRLERRARNINRWSMDLVENVIQDSLFGELGLINKTTITKIE